MPSLQPRRQIVPKMEQKQAPHEVDTVADVATTHLNQNVVKRDKKQFLETSFHFSSHAANNYGEEAGGDDDEGEVLTHLFIHSLTHSLTRSLIQDYDNLEAELLGEGGGGSHSGNLIISENTMNKRINLRLVTY